MWEWCPGFVSPCHYPFCQFTHLLLSFCSWYCGTSCASSHGLTKSYPLMHSKLLHFFWQWGQPELFSFIPARVLVLSICFFGSQCSKEQPVYLWLTLSSSWTALGFQQKDWKNKEKGSFNLPWGIVHFSNTDNLKNTKHYANTLVTLKNKIKSFVVRK